MSDTNLDIEFYKSAFEHAVELAIDLADYAESLDVELNDSLNDRMDKMLVNYTMSEGANESDAEMIVALLKLQFMLNTLSTETEIED